MPEKPVQQTSDFCTASVQSFAVSPLSACAYRKSYLWLEAVGA